MATVLHISAAGTVWWEKSAAGWVSTSGPPKGPVWVVTDLSEEAFVEINVPRIYGADRVSYIQRQLASRFPETVFRLALAPRVEGSLMDRLAPPVQTFTAVEPGDRVQAALAECSEPLAGVWSTSMLLAQLGRRTSMPANLFIVLCQAGSMRILFLRQRLPVLTRLIGASAVASEQAAEIVRTLRHLENTRVIERDAQRFGVLLLGGAEGLTAALATDRLDVVEPAAQWNPGADRDWNHLLFDLVCKNPPGQLAPLSFRATYLARNIERVAYLGCAISFALALWFTGGSLSVSLQAQRERAQVQALIDQSTAQLAKIDQSIQTFGVAPELVRQALAVDNEEIEQAPDLQADLQRLSRVIGAVPGARVKTLQWQLLNASESACAKDALSGVGAAPVAEAVVDAGVEPPPGRKVELQMTVLLAGGLGPRQLENQATSISRQLGQIQGSKVLQDPAKSLHEGDIQTSSAQMQAERDLLWCLTLPGVRGQPSPTAGEQP
jgi:hypothetical protein